MRVRPGGEGVFEEVEVRAGIQAQDGGRRRGESAVEAGVGDGGPFEGSDSGGWLLAEEVLEEYASEVGVRILGVGEVGEILRPGGMIVIVEGSEIDVLPDLFHGFTFASWGWENRGR